MKNIYKYKIYYLYKITRYTYNLKYTKKSNIKNLSRRKEIL